MKKVSLFLICCVCTTALFSQTLQNKKGEVILPEAGDWGISVSADPIFNFIGNLIGSNGQNTSPYLNFLSGNNLIMVKYYKEDKLAYRGGIRLGLGYDREVSKVQQLPLVYPSIYVDNITHTRSSNIVLTAGIEKRFGKTRLQGYYGVEAGLQYNHQSMNKSFGNPLSSNNPGQQMVSADSGVGIGLGARAFIGLEYFIFPKISLGGEFGWGVTAFYRSEGEQVVKYFNANLVQTNIYPTGSVFQFGADNNASSSIFGPMGRIRINFHL